MLFRTARPSDTNEKSQLNRASKVYLRNVKKQIPFFHSRKREFLRQLEVSLYLYCAEQRDPDTPALEAHFGTPREVANDFQEELGPSAIARSLAIQQRVTYAAIGIILAAVLPASAIVIYSRVRLFRSGFWGRHSLPGRGDSHPHRRHLLAGGIGH